MYPVKDINSKKIKRLFKVLNIKAEKAIGLVPNYP